MTQEELPDTIEEYLNDVRSGRRDGFGDEMRVILRRQFKPPSVGEMRILDKSACVKVTTWGAGAPIKKARRGKGRMLRDALEARRRKVRKLRDAGVTIEDIAEELAVSKDTVRRDIKIIGNMPP